MADNKSTKSTNKSTDTDTTSTTTEVVETTTTVDDGTTTPVVADVTVTMEPATVEPAATVTAVEPVTEVAAVTEPAPVVQTPTEVVTPVADKTPVAAAVSDATTQSEVQTNVEVKQPAIASAAEVLGSAAPVAIAETTTTEAAAPATSATVNRLADVLNSYVTSMASNVMQNSKTGAQNQVNLYRAIRQVVYSTSNADFVAGMTLLLNTVEDNITGVFSERLAYRFWQDLTLPKTERLEFENLLRLILNVAPKATRKAALQQTDLNVALNYTTKEEVRERLITYIKKITG